MGYICEDCGDRFDTPYIVREYRGEFWGAPAYENMAYCPYCGSECIDDYRGEGSEDEIDELYAQEKTQKGGLKMIEQRIAEAIGGDVNVAKVEKAVNNGILQEGYVVQSGEGPAPVFYVQDEWSGARKIDFVKRMYDSWKEQDNTEMEALLMTRIKEGFASADKFYESIIPAVISTEKNEGRLAEIVHDDISELGLSIVYRFKINTVEHVATVVLRHDHVDAFGFDFDMEKLRAAAKRRIEDELLIQRASDVFAEVGIKIDDEDDIEFYVATVNDLAFGAAVITSEKNLRKMHEAAGSEQIIVIPSSVDEVMFLPLDDDIDPALVSAMVREVNVEGPVSPENVLDDVAYIHTLNGDWRRV